MKNCAYQYYAKGKMIEDTGLITIDEAKALWQKYKGHFIEQCEGASGAEMAIWCDMDNDGDYRKIYKQVDTSEVIIKNGIAYTQVPVF
jgi:hypothetical protein